MRLRFWKPAARSGNGARTSSLQGIGKDLDTTTEFWVPQSGLDVHTYLREEDKQGIHHIGRYAWAIPVVGDRTRILDIACGAGYGSKILADAHPGIEVVGVDYDERAIEFARKTYAAPNLSYRVGNLATWQTSSGESLGQCDAVVCFDTIEHLHHREIALLEITENLATNGILLLSTPSGKRQDRLNPEWEHHKIEYGFPSLHNLLKRFFATVLHTGDGSLPNQVFWDSVINSDRPRYVNRMNPVVCTQPIQLRPRTASQS
ncbi:class I SAM-dependent methyltransferase [Myxococcota bacterium]|nr:class I SAM-dependent methyltransferase [Myxococcota bacterium]